MRSDHEIVVEALPGKIPATIEVDVSALKIGSSIHVSELTVPEGCKLKYATDYVVAFVAVPEKEEVVAPVAAAVPGAAPAEGAAAAAPAAGAAAAAPAAGADAKKAEAGAKGGKK
jgi:large subunit ribosomal protein L25